MAEKKNTAATASTDWEYILDDAYIKKMSRYFGSTSREAQLKLDTLLSHLYKICTCGIVEGNEAEALFAFYTRAINLRGLISELGTKAQQYCDDLLTATDEADRDLYG